MANKYIRFSANFFGVLGFCLLLSVLAGAKTLMVSDVDDTIKLADVQNFSSSVGYALDYQSRFYGMSEFYKALSRDNPDMKIVYLSRAPRWLMGTIHQRFLGHGDFPSGVYIPRTNHSSDDHKLKTLRELLEKEKPDKVIFFGDNGEMDPKVYAQIASEYETQGIRFYHFIRIVYSGYMSSNKGTALEVNQVGFVTPVEIALELEKQGLLSAATMQQFLEEITPRILDEKKNSWNREFVFPPYVQCENMQWRWDDDLPRFAVLDSVKKRIFQRCGLGLSANVSLDVSLDASRDTSESPSLGQ